MGQELGLNPENKTEKIEVEPKKEASPEKLDDVLTRQNERAGREIKGLKKKGEELGNILTKSGAEEGDINEFKEGEEKIETAAKEAKSDYEKGVSSLRSGELEFREDPKRFLEFEKLTQPSDDIKKLVERFRNGGELQRIENILSFLGEEKNLKHVDLERKNPKEWKKLFRKRTAEEIFESKSSYGCGDTTTLFLAMARECGIPAKFIESKRLGKSGTHSWAQVLVEGKWVDVDPTQGVKGVEFNPEKSGHGPYKIISESLGPSDSLISSYKDWKKIEKSWDYKKNAFKEGFGGKVETLKLEKMPREIELRTQLAETLRFLEEKRKAGELLLGIHYQTRELSPREKKEFWEAQKKYGEIPAPRNAIEQNITWNSGKSPLRGRIMDGFASTALNTPEKMLNSKGFFPGIERVTVDRGKDKKLSELCEWTRGIKDQFPDEEERIFHLAQMVHKKMGGENLEKISRETMKRVFGMFVGKNNMPVGDIEYGVCRHRSVLFQALASEAGLDSQMIRARVEDVGISSHHQYNQVTLENGEILVVDTMQLPALEIFSDINYEEFKLMGGFPRFGSNGLPFELYKDIKGRFCGGRLGPEGLKKVIPEEEKEK